MKTIEAKDTAVLNIGFAGEKDRTLVRFDFADISEEFPGGMIVLQAKRPCENTVYNIPLTIAEDGCAEWLVSEYDVARRGLGECQLVYATGDHICKKKVWRTNINRSLEGDLIGLPPDWEDISAQFLQAAAELQNTLRNVEDALEDIDTSIYQFDDAIARAEMAASKAGYMSLYINDEGHLIYVRTANVHHTFGISAEGHLLLTGL